MFPFKYNTLLKLIYVMKKIALIALSTFALALTVSAKNNNITKQLSDTVPVISFEQEEFDFGTIKQGDKVARTFHFTNTGGVPLKLESVRASCGCTTPEWPKEPIMPGQSSKIEVVFNSAGKLGQQKKSITIRSNANPSIKVVYLKGKVDSPESK